MSGLAELAAKADADLAKAETAKLALYESRVVEDELVSQLDRAQETTRLKSEESTDATTAAVASATALSQAITARLEALQGTATTV
ncbi:MAG: hypothetical protein AAFU85_27935 [Planctomycetota bacterium]